MESKTAYHILSRMRENMSTVFFVSNIEDIVMYLRGSDKGINTVDYNNNEIKIIYDKEYLKNKIDQEREMFIPYMYDKVSEILFKIISDNAFEFTSLAYTMIKSPYAPDVCRMLASGLYNNYIGYLYQIKQTDENTIVITF